MTPIQLLLFMSAFGAGMLIIAVFLTLAIVFALAVVGWVQGERPGRMRS